MALTRIETSDGYPLLWSLSAEGWPRFGCFQPGSQGVRKPWGGAEPEFIDFV